MANAQNDAQVDELFVLRVPDQRLGQRLQAALSEEPGQEKLSVRLEFTDPQNDRLGELEVSTEDGRHDNYFVNLQDLPTVVEAYKTYDDVNLVKVGDVGQMLTVHPTPPYAPPIEAADGVTPPMRSARQRHFKPVPKVDPAVVSSVEAELLAILCGKAPRNTQITDYEEQFVVDEAKKTGQWQLVDKRIGQAGQAQ